MTRREEYLQALITGLDEVRKLADLFPSEDGWGGGGFSLSGAGITEFGYGNLSDLLYELGLAIEKAVE